MELASLFVRPSAQPARANAAQREAPVPSGTPACYHTRKLTTWIGEPTQQAQPTHSVDSPA